MRDIASGVPWQAVEKRTYVTVIIRHSNKSGRFIRVNALVSQVCPEKPECVRACPSTAAPSTRHHPRIAHPDQMVGRKHHHELKAQSLAANKPALAQTTYGLGPAKTYLDPLVDRLADGIPSRVS